MMTDALYAANVSLIVGLLTLITGGTVAAYTAGWLTRTVKISEFRQKWIDDLRADIAAYIGAAHLWIRLYEEYNFSIEPDKRAEFEKSNSRPVQNQAYIILYRIRMRINPLLSSPTRNEDELFLKSLDSLLDPHGLFGQPSMEPYWIKRADSVAESARALLKREWEIAKKPPTIDWPPKAIGALIIAIFGLALWAIRSQFLL